MKRFKIGKEYPYTEIDDLAKSDPDNLTFTEHGVMAIGESFLVLKNQYDKTISFVLIGYNNKWGAYYKCIYKDKL